MLGLDELDQAYGKMPGHQTGQPWGWSESDALWGNGYIHALLGNTRQANEAISNALTLEPREYAGRRANLALIQALCMVWDGDISDALDHANAALRKTPPTTARRRITGEIVRALPEKARTLPAARELHALTSGESAL
jgi:Flp pilus assembly protein TadD